MIPRCSIIIRCYNEAKHLPRLLYGISKQTIQDVEIIAVDSGSTDNTPLIFRNHGIKMLFLEPESFSFGRSCNLGCRSAQGEFLVFVSAHAYPVHPTWLEELLKPFDDQLVGISYGKQRGNSLNTYSERQIFRVWYPEQNHTSQKHPFCNNANSAVRRSIWEALGFDETLTGLEDIDFANRVVQSGHKITYVPSAEITHVHQEQSSAVLKRYRREAIAYRRIFPDETFSLLDFFKLYIVNVASDFYHAWYDGEFRRQCTEILVFRLMQFWGVYRGMQQKNEVSGALKRRLYYPAGLKRNARVGLPVQDHFTIDYPE